jgi:hypothetical protein
MFRSRYWSLTIVFFLILISLISNTASASKIDKLSPHRINPGLDPTQIVTWGPSYDPHPGLAQAFGDNMNPGDGVIFKNPLCSDGLPGLEKGMCTPDRKFLSLENSLSPCIVNSETTCIKQVEVMQSSGTWTTASLNSEAFERSLSWPAFPKLDIGPAYNSSIYEYIESDSVDAQLLFVRASYIVSFADLSSGPGQYEIEISSVNRTTWKSCTEEFSDPYLTGIASNKIKWFVDSASPARTTPPTNSSVCYLRKPINNRIRLTLNMKKPPNGWIDTYLGKAEAKLSSTQGSATPFQLVIEGNPVTLPLAELTLYHSDTTSRSLFCASSISVVSRDWCSEAPRYSSVRAGYSTTSTYSSDPFKSFIEAVRLFPQQVNTASTEYSTWRARVRRNNSELLHNCSIPEGIYGLVGGNALLVNSSIPIWNSANQTLEFKVTSPHYLVNGETARGIYEMQINEKVAQCLWGTKITPKNVVISVLDENGESKLSTATIAVNNGMVIFRATGFSYSTATIKASLKNESNATPKTMTKRQTCTKGRISKVQPRGITKCPKGWKKK